MLKDKDLKVELGAGKPKTFTTKQVTTLLQEQVKRCASAIDGDNLSQYTAKKKIWAVKLVEIK